MTHPYLMSKTQNKVPNIVTLLGGGPVNMEQLQRVMRLAPYVVAADGGANYAHAHKIPVKHIVGDFDSLTNFQIWQDKGVNLVHLDEQDSTDFEKCLYTVEAGLYLCVGFLGRRLDHSLACLRSLVAYPKKSAVLIGDGDVTFRCPHDFQIEMKAGDPVSLFPLGEVAGLGSHGLRWPIEGLNFTPSGQIGTSNEALGGRMRVEITGPMLMILPLKYLEAVSDLLAAPVGVPETQDKDPR